MKTPVTVARFEYLNGTHNIYYYTNVCDKFNSILLAFIFQYHCDLTIYYAQRSYYYLVLRS